MIRIPAIVLMSLISLNVRAQDVPPPPKPQDNSPTLEFTMNYIKENLDRAAHANFVGHSTNGSAFKYKIDVTNIRTDVRTCRVGYYIRATVDGREILAVDSWFDLKSIREVAVEGMEQYFKTIDSKDGHPEANTRVEPPTFAILLKGKNPNGTQREQFFDVHDEILANRVAKALVHAVELCGGGDKDPFK